MPRRTRTSQSTGAKTAKSIDQLEAERRLKAVELKKQGKLKALTDKEWQIYQDDFNQLDKDGSGFLSPDEVAVLLEKQLNKKPTKAATEQFIQELDLNRDGKVALWEYVEHIVGTEWCLGNNCRKCQVECCPAV